MIVYAAQVFAVLFVWLILAGLACILLAGVIAAAEADIGTDDDPADIPTALPRGCPCGNCDELREIVTLELAYRAPDAERAP